jgi:hypothetical protein
MIGDKEMTAILSYRASIACLLLIPIAAFAASNPVVITQQDEDAICALAKKFNKEADAIINPFSSRFPVERLCNTQSYKALLQYREKVVPYLVRQEVLSEKASVIVGSARATRRIRNLEDLEAYQKERRAKIERVSPWFHHFPSPAFLAAAGVGGGLEGKLFTADLPLAQWWEENQARFRFTTHKRFHIDTQDRCDRHPHISTEMTNGLLSIEAVSATYLQVIERAAAEMHVPVFLGRQEYMDVLTTVRMRSVTFDEFAYLVGHHCCVTGFRYTKSGPKYHFGGNARAEPRRIMNGWGIMMWRTVFHQGEEIPITVVTRGTEPMVDPSDSAFASYGSFRICDNHRRIVRDYLPESKAEPTLPLLQRKKNCTEIDLCLADGNHLEPGEYNATFRYGDKETPSIASEVYPAHAPAASEVLGQPAP